MLMSMMIMIMIIIIMTAVMTRMIPPSIQSIAKKSKARGKGKCHFQNRHGGPPYIYIHVGMNGEMSPLSSMPSERGTHLLILSSGFVLSLSRSRLPPRSRPPPRLPARRPLSSPNPHTYRSQDRIGIGIVPWIMEWGARGSRGDEGKDGTSHHRWRHRNVRKGPAAPINRAGLCSPFCGQKAHGFAA